MECRICLEDSPPLLENICGCRGSQQYIHSNCLQSWIKVKPTGICDVCKEAFRVPQNIIRRPLFYSTLFSQQFLSTLNLILFLSFITPLYAYTLYLQQALFTTYSIAYFNLLPLIIQHPYYLLTWARPILIHENQIFFPLPTIFLYMIPFKFPILCTMAILTSIWRVHVGILAYIQR